MDRKRTNRKRAPSPKKAQGSMEYIIILAVVIIGAILAGFFYLRSLSSTKIGNSESIVAAGSPSNTVLVLALAEPLPTSASSVSVDISGGASGLTIAQSGQQGSVTMPTYVNNYPEYVFTGSNVLPSDNVTGLSYVLNGQTIQVATSTGSPLGVQPTTGNFVTP